MQQHVLLTRGGSGPQQKRRMGRGCAGGEGSAMRVGKVGSGRETGAVPA